MLQGQIAHLRDGLTEKGVSEDVEAGDAICLTAASRTAEAGGKFVTADSGGARVGEASSGPAGAERRMLSTYFSSHVRWGLRLSLQFAVQRAARH